MGKEEFSYRIAKDGKVFVHWHGGSGKREIVLKGARADRLLAELSGADRDRDREREQFALARATGNFKRGNERRSKH